MKKILIYANVFDTTVGQSISYMEFFSKFGEVILITSEMDMKKWINYGDILAVPGGMDLASYRYGEKPGFNSKLVNNHFEYLDNHLLAPWLLTGKPVIGICRGMQALNVALGGTLHRHVVDHNLESKEGRGGITHELYTNLDLEDHGDFRRWGVNSIIKQ